MKTLRALTLPAILLLLGIGFWQSESFKMIAAGLALFLMGMLSLEESFRAAGGGMLEDQLRRWTRKRISSIFAGFVATTIMQSSSLVTLLTISFVSAGLIGLGAGISVLFGANLGSTTGAWLIAGIGLKVSIADYALPMLVFGVLLNFQRARRWRSLSRALLGLGLIFLGIHYMKDGFAAFSEGIDLTAYALPGTLGLAVFTAVGAVATIILQSSHASMLLILTALAAGQITFDNALALAVGANIGTTATAMIGSISANTAGRRLAVAHVVFNLGTGAIAIAALSPLRELVELLSNWLGIPATSMALRLALFHSLFNLLGVLVFSPLTVPLEWLLTRLVREKPREISEPRYLNPAAMAEPGPALEALRQELLHLYDNAFRLTAHAVSLKRGVIRGEEPLEAAVAAARRPRELDVDEFYEKHIKPLHGAILDFAVNAQASPMSPDQSRVLADLRLAARHIVESVKSTKHLHKNLSRQMASRNIVLRDEYDRLRLVIANALRDFEKMRETGDVESGLLLDEQIVDINSFATETDERIAGLIRAHAISAAQATSLVNDTGYAADIVRQLADAGRTIFHQREPAERAALNEAALGESELAKAVSEGQNRESHPAVAEAEQVDPPGQSASESRAVDGAGQA